MKIPHVEGSKIRNTGMFPCRGVVKSVVQGPHWHGSKQAREACIRYQRTDAQNFLPILVEEDHV